MPAVQEVRSTLAELKNEVRALSPSDLEKFVQWVEKTFLIQEGQESNEDPEDVEKAWEEEISKRIDEIRTGKVECLPLQESVQAIWKKYGLTP